jgi:hypothetical protein
MKLEKLVFNQNCIAFSVGETKVMQRFLKHCLLGFTRVRVKSFSRTPQTAGWTS